MSIVIKALILFYTIFTLTVVLMVNQKLLPSPFSKQTSRETKLKFTILTICWLTIPHIFYALLFNFVFFSSSAPIQFRLAASTIFSLMFSGLFIGGFIIPWLNEKLQEISYSQTPTIEIEITHGNFSGTLDETWLPAGYGIIYQNAWQKPVISVFTQGGKDNTTIDFGNAIVIIGGKKNATEIIEPKGNIKIIVRFIDETKTSFGY